MSGGDSILSLLPKHHTTDRNQGRDSRVCWQNCTCLKPTCLDTSKLKKVFGDIHWQAEITHRCATVVWKWIRWCAFQMDLQTSIKPRLNDEIPILEARIVRCVVHVSPIIQTFNVPCEVGGFSVWLNQHGSAMWVGVLFLFLLLNRNWTVDQTNAMLVGCGWATASRLCQWDWWDTSPLEVSLLGFDLICIHPW